MSPFTRPGHQRASTRPALRAALTVTAAAAALAGTGVVTATAASAASSDDFARLRACESSGNYATNTGNGYYGAYQFDTQTWRSVGGSGLPSNASPATQDALAQRLQSQRGWAPWPACSAKLGLGSGGGSAVEAAPATHTESAPATRSEASHSVAARSESAPAERAPSERPARSSQESSSPAYGGTLLTTAFVQSFRPDVQQVQRELADRGYTLSVDGGYGPETEAVVTQFQQDAGILVDGITGPVTWSHLFG